jgi:hypothetical protein
MRVTKSNSLQLPPPESLIDVTTEIEEIIGRYYFASQDIDYVPDVMASIGAAAIFDMKLLVAAAWEVLDGNYDPEFAALAMLTIHCVAVLSAHKKKGIISRIFDDKMAKSKLKTAEKISVLINLWASENLPEADHFMGRVLTRHKAMGG